MKRFLPLALYLALLLVYTLAPALPAQLWRLEALGAGLLVLIGLIGIGKLMEARK